MRFLGFQKLILTFVTLTSFISSQSQSYNIECLSVDFNCGDIGDTLSKICRTYNRYTSPGPTYVSRGRRSVGDENTSASFHPRATHASDLAQQTVYKLELDSITLRPEEALMVTRSTLRRQRRGYVRKDPREECCSYTNFRRCNFEEVAEYCAVVREDAYTCNTTTSR